MRKVRPRSSLVEERNYVVERIQDLIQAKTTEQVRHFNSPESMYQMRGRPATGSYFPNPWRSASKIGEYEYRSFAPEWGGENPLYDGATEIIFYKSEEDLIDIND